MSIFSLFSNSNQGTLNYTVITMQWMDNGLGSSVPLEEECMAISVFAVLQIHCAFLTLIIRMHLEKVIADIYQLNRVTTELHNTFQIFVSLLF